MTVTTASTTGAADAHDDLVDRLAGLAPGDPLHTVRHARDKVAVATQGSYDALFDPALPDLTLAERLAVALMACRLTPAPALAEHYRIRLAGAGTDPSLLDAADRCAPDAAADPRQRAMLQFTRTLIERPIDGDRAALLKLPAAGLGVPAVVALAQLIAFLSYQVRLVAGLQAMRAAGPAASTAAPAAAATDVVRSAMQAAQSARGATVIRAHGFTNEPLEWRAWLDVLDLARATPEQMAVLEESHPKAKTSDYYRLLVHQPRILRERSTAFNAIMYAPGGMPRAERELGATVVSRVNGCVYCASVHAQRFEQLAKRNDTIAMVFEDPQTAGTTARERAIVKLSIDLTVRPGAMTAEDIAALKAQGLTDGEVLDLIHSVAIFAWANRLMLNLGEPVPVN